MERMVKSGKTGKAAKGVAKGKPKAAAGEPASARPELRTFLASAATAQQFCDPVVETGVLLDSVIHDLRTPLSAMSGWLEVLEAHFGEADGIVGRALLGLRRGVDSQAVGLSGLADVLMKQRIDLPVDGDCVLLERMQLALDQLEARPDSPLDQQAAARLAPFRASEARGSLRCLDAGSSLGDACATLLHALALAQEDVDPPLSVSADERGVLVSVASASGDRSAVRSLCQGLAGYSAKRPEIRAPALWFARSMLQRCGLDLRMKPVQSGGFDLLIGRIPRTS